MNRTAAGHLNQDSVDWSLQGLLFHALCLWVSRTSLLLTCCFLFSSGEGTPCLTLKNWGSTWKLSSVADGAGRHNEGESHLQVLAWAEALQH